MSLLCLLCHLAWSQQDSVLLDGVSVYSSRMRTFAAADKIILIDSGIQKMNDGNSLAMLLTKIAPLNIRAYGIGGLSTPSLRGTGSNQTAVVWEGLNLQSQMNGSLDLNLVPSIMVDDVSIQFGGSSSMFGSGAMGGTIQMGSSAPSFQSGISASLHEQLGSFGLQSHAFKVKAATQKLSLGVRAFLKEADNDFEFYNVYNQSDETMRNAQVKQYGILTELAYRPLPNGLLELKHWYQDNDTHVPKTAGAGQESNAIQYDQFHRAILKYDQKLSNAWRLNYKLGLLDHVLNYDDKINTHSHSHSQSIINEALFNYRASRHLQLEIGLNATHESGDADNYSDIQDRNRMALFVSSHLAIRQKLELNLAIRTNMVDGDFKPILPSLGLNYHTNSWLDIKAKVAKSYRIPTFNDLYWSGSGAKGNPDLVPENGMSYEIGYLIHAKKESLSFHYEGTVFYNHILDWIFWNDLGSYWTPINLKELWSYGIEQNLHAQYQLNQNSRITLDGNYQFVLSTPEKPDELFGNLQQVYTPKHQGNAFVQYHWRSIQAGVNLIYAGKQYSDDGNIEIRAVDPYALTDLSVGYKFALAQKHAIQSTLQVKNIFDTSYEVRRAYPMPGINYQLNLVYTFN
ncbi:TonB-dependent receptor [Reichenbachiella agarivorans]|uniref:TonB-dependent receptor n=1 Tax=Reichenbachiella agarivorans TaxID=2979464 RepID=A0ABY6CP47_9BACT|nr:TonB-dependent receptor [Reichenbachiella agarivorans]UXP32149.1 TonB-dependent receptor [Reichenbachiella agarivorans]